VSHTYWQYNPSPGWAGGSYAANYQLFGASVSGTNLRGPAFSLANIPDGSSNTVGIAEVFAATAISTITSTPIGSSSSGNPGGNCIWYMSWYEGSPTFLVAPVFANSENFANWAGLPQAGVYPAGADKALSQSGHSSGVNVTLMDGSIRNINTSLSQLTWQYALTPADGMPLNSDW
jgi:hypothetical protein